jgi:hypothetical protein
MATAGPSRFAALPRTVRLGFGVQSFLQDALNISNAPSTIAQNALSSLFRGKKVATIIVPEAIVLAITAGFVLLRRPLSRTPMKEFRVKRGDVLPVDECIVTWLGGLKYHSTLLFPTGVTAPVVRLSASRNALIVSPRFVAFSYIPTWSVPVHDIVDLQLTRNGIRLNTNDGAACFPGLFQGPYT